MQQIARIATLLLAISLVSCNKTSTPPDLPYDPIKVETVAQVAAMNQALGWKIFKAEQLAKPDENVLISPYSIQTAFQMAINGAKGNTLDEFLNFMECPGCSVADLNDLHADLNTLLTEQSGKPKLTVANGFFYDSKRMSLQTSFAQSLNDHYHAGMQNMNFDAEQPSLDAINGWVKTHTNNKIDKILNKIGPLDVAFLINALHFKGDWATGFASALTTNLPFKKKDGSTSNLAFLHADRNFSFDQTADYNIVDIPFQDSTYSISLLQPGTQNTDADWHLKITPSIWKGLYDGIQYNRAAVFVPKLKIAYENDLVQSLQSLGILDAFSDLKADFTGMGTAPLNIFINQLQHKAVLEMDEKGVEGAAVTSIGFGVNSIPPTFMFNQPFVLVLRHVATNTMVFMGYIADPKQ
jgi:serpin B